MAVSAVHRASARPVKSQHFAIQLAGVPATKVPVSKQVNDAQKTVYASTWGGDMNAVSAFKVDPKQLGSAMANDAKTGSFKKFLWEAGLVTTGNTVKTFQTSDNPWSKFNNSLARVKDAGADLNSWLKSGDVSDADLTNMSGAVAELKKFLSVPGGKVFHVSIGMAMPEDSVESIVGVNAKTGDVRMLSAYYAAG
jgi:hypothetical protein